ncbi:hypothetical protein V493_07207 [Pseudogymnoascus sp. VKM F-4281 (FW-2241)]|nr:hypothetical protein V493_07207 [Pseudogymnoascus sp. VKM F-4281 (FW-2241)]
MSVKLGLEMKEEAQSQVASLSMAVPNDTHYRLANPVKGDFGDNDDIDINSVSSVDHEALWLILFDNADDPKVLGDYWPEGSGSVLITSRDPLAKRLFSTRSSSLDLESLSDVDGGALLLKLTESDESPEEDAEVTAQSTSHNLAGLPLAISQMAGIIRRQDLSLHEFLSTYEDKNERTALYGMKFHTGAKAFKYSVATVWAFEKLSPEAKELLKIISFLDPDTIQEGIIFDAAVQLGNVPFTKFTFNNARTNLSQSSLIKRDKGKNELSEYRISTHRLVQDAILANTSIEGIDSVFEVLVGLPWREWPSAMDAPTRPSAILSHKVSGQRYQVKRYPVCVALYPHVIRLKQLWPSITESSVATKTQFAALLNDAAWYQTERGRTRDFEGFWTLAQDLCESIPGSDADLILADLHFSLSLHASITNDHRGSRMHKEAFLTLQKSICESIAPDFVDARLGLAYAELGVGLIDVERLDEAVEAFRQERVILERLGIRIPLSRDANLAIARMMRRELVLAERLLVEHLELSEVTRCANTTLR